MRAVLVGVVVGIVLVVAGLSVRTPAVPTYAPTPPAAADAGRRLVGPVLYTVDATAADTWRYFSFRLGSVIETPRAGEWDLAFKRYSIIAGDGVGILDLGEARLDDVRAVPTTGYVVNEGRAEPRNAAIASWYRYGFFSHVLSPKPHVWAVRTADGRYAKLEMVGYYCPGGRPGCPTFRYVYQGDGTTVVGGPEMAPPSSEHPGKAVVPLDNRAG
jgi:heme-binding HmuY-like protein